MLTRYSADQYGIDAIVARRDEFYASHWAATSLDCVEDQLLVINQ